MEEIARLARPDIYAMKPYSSARTEGSYYARIYLDGNENPYPPYPGTDDQVGYNHYPEPQPHELLDRFSELFGAPREQLFLSRGVDEAIDLLVRAFCAAGTDGILITPPTFVMYETSAEIQNASVYRVPLLPDNFQLDVEAMLATQRENPGIKLVFVCSPNNPTSNLMNRADILRLADELFGRALVVADQLYVDYSGEAPLSTEIAEHPNLVVLRPVSKEYSLAGERCGITVADPEVIAILGRIMAPYPLTVSSIRNVARAISEDGYEYGRKNIRLVLEERDRVCAALEAFSSVTRIYPSDANFLLVETSDPKLLVGTMADEGIKLRDRSGVVAGTVRISIGTPEQNDEMLRVFGEYAQKTHG